MKLPSLRVVTISRPMCAPSLCAVSLLEVLVDGHVRRARWAENQLDPGGQSRWRCGRLLRADPSPPGCCSSLRHNALTAKKPHRGCPALVVECFRLSMSRFSRTELARKGLLVCTATRAEHDRRRVTLRFLRVKVVTEPFCRGLGQRPALLLPHWHPPAHKTTQHSHRLHSKLSHRDSAPVQ